MYYFALNDVGNLKAIRNLYKYMYRLTANEKRYNPEWVEFREKMDSLYLE
ncbi:hypothetical protein [Clostridium gasigenes]|nr:hypothetical protein [Clostridium gasigenes]